MGSVALAGLIGELRAVPEHRRFTNVALSFEEVAAGARPIRKLVVDVWVFDRPHRRTLLVNHPRRGWVMPGGKLEDGETFRAGAARELAEETGLVVAETDLRAIGAYLGSEPDEREVGVGLAYTTVVDPELPLAPEPGQPAKWWSLDDSWPSIYPHDRDRLRSYCVDISGTTRHAEPQ